MDFTVPSKRCENKESEKIDKYLDLARELKRLLNMRMTVIPMIIGALGMVHKGLKKKQCEVEIRDNPDYSIAKMSFNT